MTRRYDKMVCKQSSSCKFRWYQPLLSGILLVLVVVLWLPMSADAQFTNPNNKQNSPAVSKEKSSSSSSSSSNGRSKDSYNLISLEESLKKSLHQDAQAARERYWKKTLEEIRSIGMTNTKKKLETTQPKEESSSPLPSNPMEPLKLNDRWKLLSIATDKGVKVNEDDTNIPKPPERYNGALSWERLLQEWSEDIQEYLDKIEASGNRKGYPMSTWGMFKEENQKGQQEKQQKKDTKDASTSIRLISDPTNAKIIAAESQKDTTSSSNSKAPRPIPAPRKSGEAVLPHTDVSDRSKRVWIVTTASLPWMTGTAVNPLLRAAYMCEGRNDAGGSVTLMLPWLERKEDQIAVYGPDKTFDSQAQQEDYIRDWLLNSAKMPDASNELNIRWYTAWNNKVENSIYSMGDIVADISEEEVDIIVLEEPEHLNWYRAPGESWTKKFKHVVGIIHTNYFVYAQDQPGALVRAPAMKLLCTWMCRSHTHRLIKLSGTLGQYAPEKELIENVHGVRGAFIDAGLDLRDKLQSPEAENDPVFSPTAEPTVYFIGKMLWSKGIGSLMELLKYADETANIKIHVDMYGGGPDKGAAEQRSNKMGLDMTFHGPIDHPELATTHKIFINPSTSEVLCTTVAEALAMGKFVVLPSHPSNDFFAQFPNCLPYTSKEEFVGNLYYALTHSPEPLSEEYSYALTWKAATERFEASACIPVEEAEQFKEWEASGEAGVEITLPPLIENEKGRNVLAKSLQKSRDDFRKFRYTLSKDIETSRVLPKPMRESLVKELDKRLDLDIDKFLTSPKLEVKLSPAELDKRCIELYESFAKGPSGDLLRAIGGGNEVAMQHRYMKRQALKQLQASRGTNATIPFFFNYNESVEEGTTASQLVRWTMRRNARNMTNTPAHYRLPSQVKAANEATAQKEEDTMRMSISQPKKQGTHLHSSSSSWSAGVAVPPPSRLITNAKVISARQSAKGMSLLI